MYLEISRKIPVGVFENVSQNDRGSDRGVVTMSDIVFEQLVLTHYFFQMVQVLILSQWFPEGLPVQAVWVPDDFRNGLSHQLFYAAYSALLQHFLCLFCIRSDVAV